MLVYETMGLMLKFELHFQFLQFPNSTTQKFFILPITHYLIKWSFKSF
jgi:hypothetical protein